jgi:hypothetical protein
VPGYAAAEQMALRPESITLVGTERTEADGSRSRLYARICAGTIGEWRWLRVPDVDAELLTTATGDIRRRLPAPRGQFSPDVAAGAVGAVVNLPVWFAVPGGQWAAVTATAAALGAAVTLTATPTTLRFTPGDGGRAVSCAGPGPVYTPGSAVPAGGPPACSYTYRDASTVAANGRSWPASLTVAWDVTWRASNGESGVLDPLTTSSPVEVVVREIQALERSGS